MYNNKCFATVTRTEQDVPSLNSSALQKNRFETVMTTERDGPKCKSSASQKNGHFATVYEKRAKWLMRLILQPGIRMVIDTNVGRIIAYEEDFGNFLQSIQAKTRIMLQIKPQSPSSKFFTIYSSLIPLPLGVMVLKTDTGFKYIINKYVHSLKKRKVN